ncbi:CAMK protein kinase [Kwoniella heveanensis BCC8398]|uniref:CAMK protein kinase n=1 Tax=Kwoniella heveanensis BCC8398 TaxID=1296120 RepID=A0A1B9GQ84_9TREE|nr:CAMK protein kinase [Kwoniella heveanensis BCC8398]
MSQSQSYADYGFEPTQLSQPYFSQTQGTQGTAFANSQVEPRRKYWAVFIPTNAERDILKIPWSKPFVQMGRGPYVLSKNDVILQEKRISNIHCKITLGMQGPNGSGSSSATVQSWKDGEAEPEVWIEDLKSSNGTFVNGVRVTNRRLLQHGDEISLGHAGTLDHHDVRYIFRSVGSKGMKLGQNGSKALDMVGAVYERYQVLDRLGKGTFAEVRKAVDVETGALRAIKQIIKHRFAGNEKTLALFHREIEISRSLEHENICRLLDYYEDPQHICLVLEYIDGGDLLDYIMNWPSETGGGLPEGHAADLTVQICRAMAYTHAMGVTHRDLKPENILLTKETDDSPPMVKIADFGLAKMVHAETMLTSMVGTPQYLAPEVVMQTRQQPGYENVVDSWSVGIIVYSMMTKALPFDEDAEQGVEQRIKARFTQAADTELLVRLGISDLAIDFISGLLAKDPSKRLSMAQALEHEWLAGPSSQRSESQAQPLGGDSVWSIESFDDIYRHVDERNAEGGWSRPMTASGTNFESLAENGSEDFSQPMGNLHLNTPLIKSTVRGEMTPAGSVPPSPIQSESMAPQTSALPQGNGQAQSTPNAKAQDRLTVKVDDSPLALTDNNAILPTPITPNHDQNTTVKRKFERNGNGDTNGEMFSSGSLSPVPAPAAQLPQQAQDRDRMDLDSSNKPSSAAPGNVGVNGADHAVNGGVGTKDKKGLVRMPTRQSTRTTRARKSMRLA